MPFVNTGKVLCPTYANTTSLAGFAKTKWRTSWVLLGQRFLNADLTYENFSVNCFSPLACKVLAGGEPTGLKCYGYTKMPGKTVGSMF